MRDWERTVISQYSQSPRLVSLLSSINAWLDPRANLEEFYNKVFNIDTAEGYGLDVWGRIVGVQRALTVIANRYFGFAEAAAGGSPFVVGFNTAPFYSGKPYTSNFELTDQAYRLCILAKAAANITNGSIPAINQILLHLFPNRGNAFVAEGVYRPGGLIFGFAEAMSASVRGFNQAPFGDYTASRPGGMQMTYVFQFPLETWEVSIVTNSGVLPKPVGVKALYSFRT